MTFKKLAFLWAMLSTLIGSAADNYAGGLATTLRASVISYRPIGSAELVERQSEALKALRHFEAVLALSKGAADGWKDILSLNDLRKQLDAGAKADLEQLDVIQLRFFQDLVGIENLAVLSLRAISCFSSSIDCFIFRTSPALASSFRFASSRATAPFLLAAALLLARIMSMMSL